MKASVVIAASMALWTGASPAPGQLRVGDAAPAFTVTDWLKGAPEDLVSGKGKKIYVLDFWATWCVPCLQNIPHLTQLQKKYADQGVVVIGMTGPGLDRRQQLSQVKRFVNGQSEQMGYTIAWDQTNKMEIDYLIAAGAPGIPHAFVIDKSGRVVWQGHPQFGMDEVLARLLAGTFDLEREIARSRAEAKLNQLLMPFELAMRSGDFKKAVAILEEALAVDPAHYGVLTIIYQVYTSDLHDPGAYRTWVESFIDKHQANSEALVALAQVLLGIESPGQRLPDLMLRAARGAFDAAAGKNVEAIEVYARAAQEVGNLDEAIRLQTLAVDVAPEPLKARAAKALEYYRTCRDLRDRSF